MFVRNSTAIYLECDFSKGHVLPCLRNGLIPSRCDFTAHGSCNTAFLVERKHGSAGDYSIAGLEDLLSVQRKTIPDLVGCCGA